jgi:hypothetical protein
MWATSPTLRVRTVALGRDGQTVQELRMSGGATGSGGHGSERDPTERTIEYGVFAAVLLLVLGVTPWRTGKYFAGQLDWVVLAKTGLLIAALLIVLWAKGSVSRSGRSTNTVIAPALFLAALYLALSAVGALLSGSFVSSVELSVRAVVVGFVVLVLIELVGPMNMISALSRVLTGVAIFIAATGSLDSSAFPGRLSGNFPPVGPNEIAFLAAVPTLYFVWRSVNVDTSLVRILAVLTLGAIIFLTLSRTTTAVVALVVIFLIIRGIRDGRLRLCAIIGAAICLLFTLFLTGAIQSFGSRGGTDSIESLGSRSIAWNAVLHSPRNPLQLLFGEGLATKLIPVTGQFWKTQVIDSSWVSGFAQAGLIGLMAAAALVLYAARQALKVPHPANDLWLALLMLVLVRSIFESGLLDTSASFVVLMTISIGAATHAHLG